MLFLSDEEQLIIDRQCSHCKLWDDDEGCKHGEVYHYNMLSKHPIDDCRAFDDHKKETCANGSLSS